MPKLKRLLHFSCSLHLAQISAVAINRNVDCSKWRLEAASALDVSADNVFCEVTRLPFDPNGDRPPVAAIVPADDGKDSLPVGAWVGIAVGAASACCCVPFAFLLWRRRKKKEKKPKQVEGEEDEDHPAQQRSSEEGPASQRGGGASQRRGGSAEGPYDEADASMVWPSVSRGPSRQPSMAGGTVVPTVEGGDEEALQRHASKSSLPPLPPRGVRVFACCCSSVVLWPVLCTCLCQEKAAALPCGHVGIRDPFPHLCLGLAPTLRGGDLASRSCVHTQCLHAPSTVYTSARSTWAAAAHNQSCPCS